jgi:hypothetical protein
MQGTSRPSVWVAALMIAVTAAGCGSTATSHASGTTTSGPPHVSTTTGPTTTTLVTGPPTNGTAVIDDDIVDHTDAKSVATAFFEAYYSKFTPGTPPAQFAAALAYLTNPTVTAQLTLVPPPVSTNTTIGGDTTVTMTGPNTYALTGTLRNTTSETPVGQAKASEVMMPLPDGTWRVWQFTPGG